MLEAFATVSAAVSPSAFDDAHLTALMHPTRLVEAAAAVAAFLMVCLASIVCGYFGVVY